jgi:hypothetical protein
MIRIVAFLFSLVLMCGCGLGAWAQERLQSGSQASFSARFTPVAKRHKRYRQGKHPSGHKKSRHRGNHPQGHQS